MKQFAFVFAFCMLTACQSPNQEQNPITNDPGSNPPSEISTPTPSASPSPTVTPTPSATPKPSVTPSPTPSQSDHLSVVIQQSSNFDSKALASLEKARGLLEIVVNSDDFKQKVLHFTYQGQETYVQNNGYSNSQIYDLIMAGAEQYPSKTTANHTMDLYLELYTANGSSTIGYTSPSTKTIYMNTYFYNSASAGDIAGNMMHEWLHKLGFDHDSAVTARRPSSVPYAIGYIARDLVKKLQ